MGLAGDGEASNRKGNIGHRDGASHDAVFDDIEPRRGHDRENPPEIELIEPVAGDLRTGLLEQGNSPRTGAAIVGGDAVLSAVGEEDRRESAADPVT